MRTKYILLLLIFLIVITGFSQKTNKRFYYAYKEKIFLDESPDKIIVRYKHNKNSEKRKLSLYSDIKDKHIKWVDDSTCVISIHKHEKGKFKEKLKKQPDVLMCNSIYNIDSGLEMGVTDEILVRFNDDVTDKEIRKLHQKMNVRLVKENELYQLIKVPSGVDALEIANLYQESGLVRFSHPNFICEIEFQQHIPNDTYFANQFYLHNTGQVFTDVHLGNSDADIDAPEAWDITKGSSNIIVAVLDQGVTSNHPDLPNSRQVRLNGSNFSGGDANNPSPTGDDNHGNACAGVIAATQDNNQGISGIAPNCRIMPIRMIGASADGVAQAINFAKNNGAHIISNSWSYNSINQNFIPAVRDAINLATT